MLFHYLNVNGVAQKEFVQYTVNAAYYLQVFLTLRNKAAVAWMLQHDNSPSDIAICDHEFLT